MPNRQLSGNELDLANQILLEVRTCIKELAGRDNALEWALRRKVYKELMYDERGKPVQRRFLKAKLMIKQKGDCAQCGNTLPHRGAVLDRLQAMLGYTIENTRLLCPKCDTELQEARGYA